MFCSKCGKEVEQDMQFCNNCGNKVENSTSTKKCNSRNHKIVVIIAFIIISVGIIFSLNTISTKIERNKEQKRIEQERIEKEQERIEQERIQQQKKIDEENSQKHAEELARNWIRDFYDVYMYLEFKYDTKKISNTEYLVRARGYARSEGKLHLIVDTTLKIQNEEVSVYSFNY